MTDEYRIPEIIWGDADKHCVILHYDYGTDTLKIAIRKNGDIIARAFVEWGDFHACVHDIRKRKRSQSLADTTTPYASGSE